MNIKKSMKHSKGITLLILVISIIMILIITGTLTYSAYEYIELKAVKNMYNDIEKLDDKVASYYSKYGDIPVEQIYDNSILQSMLTAIGENLNPNDGNTYYVLELNALDGISLNYGQGYGDYKNGSDINNIDNIYIINDISHTIYYPKGIKVSGKTYYTTPEKYDQVTTAIEVKNDAKLIKSGLNTGAKAKLIIAAQDDDGLKSVTLYNNLTEIKTITYNTNTTESKLETLYVNVPFYGDANWYVVSTDINDQTITSQTLSIENTTQIGNKEDLKKLAAKVNEGINFQGVTLNQINNIDWGASWDEQSKQLTIGENFIQIGSATNQFLGTYDANGYKINNVYQLKTDNSSTGIFGTIGYTASYVGAVKNLTVSGIFIKSSGTGDASVIANVNNGIIDKCKNEAQVMYMANGNGQVSGIVSENNNIVSECVNNGIIISSTNSYVGGIVAKNNDALAGTESKYSQITDCENRGNVTGIGTTGGICGYNNSFISDTVNTSIVNSTNYSVIQTSSGIIGGIVGENRGKVIGCNNILNSQVKNTGSDASLKIGGIAGYNVAKIITSKNNGAIDSNSGIVGGIVGQNYSGSIEKTYSSGDILGSGLYVGGIVRTNIR